MCVCERRACFRRVFRLAFVSILAGILKSARRQTRLFHWRAVRKRGLYQQNRRVKVILSESEPVFSGSGMTRMLEFDMMISNYEKVEC